MVRRSPLGHGFETREDVYTPAEDSWLLARALDEAGPHEGARAADAGTGAGVAAVTLAEAGADRVVAVDRNPAAPPLARANAARNGLGDAVDPVVGHLATPLAAGAVDVLACNPPYLPEGPDLADWEEAALEGGPDGVAVAAELVRDLPRVLAPEGVAYLLVSTRGDLEALDQATGEAGLEARVVARESFPFEELRVRELRRSRS